MYQIIEFSCPNQSYKTLHQKSILTNSWQKIENWNISWFILNSKSFFKLDSKNQMQVFPKNLIFRPKNGDLEQCGTTSVGMYVALLKKSKLLLFFWFINCSNPLVNLAERNTCWCLMVCQKLFDGFFVEFLLNHDSFVVMLRHISYYFVKR